MRLGGATGAAPASRSGHHVRSQPAPPAPMLRNGASGAACSLRSFQFDAHPLGQCQPHRPWRCGQPRLHTANAQAHDRRCHLHSPVLRNGEWRRQRLTISNSTSTPLARLGTRNHNSHVRGSASAPGSPQPHPVTLAASARTTSNAPPLRDHERPPRNQRQQSHERPQSRFVRARLRCSSRASLPLTPRLARLLQQLECALPLRFGKDKVS